MREVISRHTPIRQMLSVMSSHNKEDRVAHIPYPRDQPNKPSTHQPVHLSIHPSICPPFRYYPQHIHPAIHLPTHSPKIPTSSPPNRLPIQPPIFFSQLHKRFLFTHPHFRMSFHFQSITQKNSLFSDSHEKIRNISHIFPFAYSPLKIRYQILGLSCGPPCTWLRSTGGQVENCCSTQHRVLGQQCRC